MVEKRLFYIEMTWRKFTLALIPLCFILVFIIDLNELLDKKHSAMGVIFVLTLMNYADVFFSRRVVSPTSYTLFLYYVISIIGAVIISYSSEVAWVILIVFILRFVFAATCINTAYGEEYFALVQKEEKLKKGFSNVFATASQRKENGKGIIDLVLFFIALIGFFLLRDYYVNIYNSKEIKESFSKCNSSRFIKYPQENKIAIGKCYNKLNNLIYINYYANDAQIDDRYIFENGELKELYDYYIFRDGDSYLKYKLTNIQKTQKSYKEESKKFFYYKAYMTKYSFRTKKTREKEVYFNYRENKYTQYFDKSDIEK